VESGSDVKKRADDRRRYLSLLTTFSVSIILWFGGAALFWFTERVSISSVQRIGLKVAVL
jgi:hypothetical protein